MADIYGDEGGLSVAPELCAGDNGGNARLLVSEATPTPLTVSASFREGRSSSRRRAPLRPPSLDADDFLTLMHGSDPVKVELNRLENEVRDKDRELGEAQAEIKALKLSERLREKAVEELTEELKKVDEKLKLTESLLETKVLADAHLP